MSFRSDIIAFVFVKIIFFVAKTLCNCIRGIATPMQLHTRVGLDELPG